MFLNNKFILASKSRSRILIFKNNHLNFFQIKPKCDENLIKKQLLTKNIPAIKISLELAKAKAKSVSNIKRHLLVVGSDTIIELSPIASPFRESEVNTPHPSEIVSPEKEKPNITPELALIEKPFALASPP